MSDLLAIGSSGLRAYQAALATVSDNIANSATPGFARRSVVMSETVSTNGLLAQTRQTIGNGVALAGIDRSSDELRNAAARGASSDLQRTSASITWLGRVEGALTGNQLTDRFTDFFNSAKTLAADPTASGARASFLESATGVATAFATTARSLDQVNADLDSTAESSVAEINRLAVALAKVNEGLGRTPFLTTSQAQLLDQRDGILDRMAALTDITVTQTNSSRVDVKLGGPAGPSLVQGVDYGQVSYVRNNEGAVSFSVLRQGDSSSFSPQGGQFAGFADSARRVADTRTKLSDMATNFVAAANGVQAKGEDQDGNPGQPLFTVGSAPTSFALALTSGRQIAAAGPGKGARDNSNLANFETMRASDNFEDQATALVADNAATLSGRKAVADAQGAILDGANTARDEVSGVNLDNEGVELLRFQAAYQASSKVIQIARDTIQTLLQIT